MLVREATLADADEMALLRACSIRQLCGADHGNLPSAMESWIGAPDKFLRLLQQGETTLLVVEIEGVLAGLGGIAGDVVTLNYVHPAYRFRGVSKALMQALEARLAQSGINLGRLRSTATAVRFYQSIGWVETGPGTANEGTPMEKRL